MNLFPRISVIFPVWSEVSGTPLISYWWHWCNYSSSIRPSHCLPPLVCLLLLWEDTALLLRWPKSYVWELKTLSHTQGHECLLQNWINCSCVGMGHQSLRGHDYPCADISICITDSWLSHEKSCVLELLLVWTFPSQEQRWIWGRKPC